MTYRWIICCSLAFLTVATAQHSDDYAETMFRLKELRHRSVLLPLSRPLSPGQEDFDVTYYNLDLQLFPLTKTLSGSVTVVARIRSSSLTSLKLDLAQSMTVQSVAVEGTYVTFTHGSGLLAFPLNRLYLSGELVTVTVQYGGAPGGTGFGSFAFQSTTDGRPWIWTLSEPYGARDWWPCKDHPSDKADSVDISVTTDAALTVGSQGILTAVIVNGNGTKTHHWRHRYPTATYLVSLAVAPYAEVSGWFRYAPADSMPVVNYALPAQLASAATSLPMTVNMLHIFSDLYGLYPFVKEKYGHAQFGWGGGMEHQTLTSLGSFSENLIAHELAHQWFGDMITMSTWPDIWLNEGFATYSVALYREKQYGPAAYRQLMDFEKSNARLAQGRLSVQDTTSVQSLFDSRLVYSKGASVLHMLRRVLGDSLFFHAIRRYAEEPSFRYATASTADFRSVCESVSGRNLGWFFDQWVYGRGFPSLQYDWSVTNGGSGVSVELRIRQTNKAGNPATFTLPLDVRLSDGVRDTTIAVEVTSAVEGFTLPLPFTPTTVTLDPDGWVLIDVSQTTVAIRKGEVVPDSFILGQNYPNPFNGNTVIPFTLPEDATVTLEIFSMLGERLFVLSPGTRFPAGEHALRFSPDEGSQTPFPTGVYFYRLIPSNRSPKIGTMVYLR